MSKDWPGRKPKEDDVVLSTGQRVPNPYALMQLSLMKMMYDSPEDLLEFCYPLMQEASELADEQSNNFLANLYKVKEIAPRKNQLVREQCRTIAAILWAQNPSYQIKQIIEHEWMAKFSEGMTYGERTIREWIKDLDPRPAEEKKTPFKKKEPV